ncbi:hypothetical protein QWY31_03430 [Cytophagales bacterium LB-30]|uniref:Tetratricopeptide repeat protein n=1 Tax=Shiella aurantiaca TaxID=3058365 RepID=A0ABT8F264_9BACT|nr:hypothetical protein [Shiella aurantiaca]MDN4164536.1 hypothetical protein [Shiella aurantiaca]
MKTTRKILVGLCLLLLCVHGVFGQKVRYKDLVPTLEVSDQADGFEMLKAYIINDLDNPNANLRLALIYQDRYRSADPLTEYDKVMANAEQAKNRFLKAKLLIDEREIRKNEEYYLSIASTVDAKGKTAVNAPQILSDISQGYEQADQLLLKLPEIYQAFTASVAAYDKAIKLFAEINGQYASLDELYLLYDANLEQKLLALKEHFQTAVQHFDQYRSLLTAYPLENHNQVYEIKPILTYRLEGLITQMNFLEDRLIFWDYARWVDQIMANESAEIKKLRADIQRNEEAMNEALKRAPGIPSTEFKAVPLEKATVFNLKKYDYQSLVVALLEYKQFKQELVNRLQNKGYFDSAQTLEAARKYAFYSDIISHARIADSLLIKIRQRNTEEKIAKHPDYFAKNYGGSQGLTQFAQTERNENNRLFAETVGQLRTSILQELGAQQSAETKAIKYKAFQMPLQLSEQAVDSLQAGQMLTTQVKKSPDGSTYVAGVFMPDKKTNLRTTYLARVGADGKLLWLKEFNPAIDSLGNQGNTQPGGIELTKEGCLVLLFSESIDRSSKKNTLLYLSDKAEEKFVKTLDTKAYPRQVSFKESNASFILTFKGETEKQDPFIRENLFFMNINAIGDILWTREMEYAGTFESVINLQDGYLFVGNYSQMNDLSGRLQRTKANEGQTNAWLMRIDNKGDRKGLLLIANPVAYAITEVVKVNDANINLLGYQGPWEQVQGRKIEESDELVHMIFDANLREVSSSL